MLKFIYTVFIGLLFATFIGVGIATFYEYPKQPEYISPPLTPEKTATESAQTNEAFQKYEAINRKQQDEYQKQYKAYSRNVSIIALVFALIAVVVSLTFIKNLQVISDGLLLGGVLTLLYSIGWGFATDDNKFRFLVVTIGFVISLILGYLKFVKPQLAKDTKTATP
jgi:hypothetical protein